MMVFTNKVNSVPTQEAGGGDVEGGGDREDRGSGSMEGSVEGAPAAVLDDGDNEEDEG